MRTKKVVFDCMLFLRALVSEKSSSLACFKLVEERRVKLLLSAEILAEIKGVLNRFDVQQKFPTLIPARIEAFLKKAQGLSSLVQEVPTVFTLTRDPKDEPYLNLAIAGGAKYLVTWNERHLNYLMRRDTPEGRDFCARFPELLIVTPPEFLQAMRGELLRETQPEAGSEGP